MRILFLSDQFPYPLHDGGNLRTFHLLAGLAAEHEVTLVAHSPQNASRILSEFPINCRVVIVKKPSAASRAISCMRQSGRAGQSLFVAKNWSNPLLDAADVELRQTSYDAIHFNHLDTACYSCVRDWPQIKIFDTHNCLSAMAGQAASAAPATWQRGLFAHEASRLRSSESAVCSRMDQNLVCSSVDEEVFRGLCSNANYKVIPNGVDTRCFVPNPMAVEQKASVVFTGAMNYFPNEQAACFFCHEVMPRLSVASTKAYFVGRLPSSKVRRLHDGRRVFVTGEVDDVRPYVLRSQVYIVPLQHGSGTRLKILEAFAMGKAVVSTSIGAEGIPATDGKELMLANTAEEFACAIDRLLTDPSLRRSLGTAARKFVVQNFDWAQIQSNIRETYLCLEDQKHLAEHA